MNQFIPMISVNSNCYNTFINKNIQTDELEVINRHINIIQKNITDNITNFAKDYETMIAKKSIQSQAQNQLLPMFPIQIPLIPLLLCRLQSNFDQQIVPQEILSMQQIQQLQQLQQPQQQFEQPQQCEKSKQFEQSVQQIELHQIQTRQIKQLELEKIKSKMTNHSSIPINESTKTIKKKVSNHNKVFTQNDLIILNAAFHENNNPDRLILNNLAEKLQRNAIDISRWFSRKRNNPLLMRQYFKNDDLIILNGEFAKNTHPTKLTLHNLATKLQRSVASVNKWFCNKRNRNSLSRKNNKN